jgi:Antibiotic biosynthesis monooxygenase
METTDIRKFQSRTADAVRVLAFFKAKPGKGRELEKALLTLIGPMRSEPGNIAYVLHSSTKTPTSPFLTRYLSYTERLRRMAKSRTSRACDEKSSICLLRR